jgi:hypothetical protein
VAPTKKKNAFWSRDIKAARQLNENATATGETPPPVNVSIIREGVKTALNQMNEKPVGAVCFQQPPKRRPQPAQGLDMFAMHGRRSNYERSYGNYGLLGGSTFLGGSTMYGNAADEEVDDNVQYVGLEDMGRLLGLDQEDDEVAIDHTAIGRRVGRGRYI